MFRNLVEEYMEEEGRTESGWVRSPEAIVLFRFARWLERRGLTPIAGDGTDGPPCGCDAATNTVCLEHAGYVNPSRA